MGFPAVSRLTVLLLIAVCSEAARILVVPNQSLSHVRYFSQVSRPLVDRGHEVFALMNGACVKSVTTLEKAGVNVLKYYTDTGTCFTEQSKDFAKDIFAKDEKVDPKAMLQKQAKSFLPDGEAIFNDKALLDEIVAKEFDLCILDGFILTLYNYIIPYKLNIPYISLTTSFVPTLAGLPALPSFSPGMLNPSSDVMDFEERIKSTADALVVPFIIKSLVTNHDSLLGKFAPEKAEIPLLTLMKRSQLWLVNTDSVLDYPRVTLPHIINVGGLSTVPPKPLPEDLQKVMDAASNGVVVLSFGSLAKDFPDYIIMKIINAFKQFQDLTFVMKYNGPELESLPDNIHLLEWLPQNDLLAHPSVKIFITHCGNNGQFESLYHGVPMIGLPIFGDQPYNAHRMAVKGFGIAMNIHSFSTEELATNIREISTNDSYNAAIEKASRIYKSRIQTARERAIYWIEHVIEFGSSHLVSHAVELEWYQYWMLDVILCLFLTFVVAIVIVFLVLRTCYRKLISGYVKPKTA